MSDRRLRNHQRALQRGQLLGFLHTSHYPRARPRPAFDAHHFRVFRFSHNQDALIVPLLLADFFMDARHKRTG